MIQVNEGRIYNRSRYDLCITVGGRANTTEVNAKSLRRSIAAIGEAGRDGVAVVLQGKLVDNVIQEAGIVAQVKQPKPAAAWKQAPRCLPYSMAGCS